MSPRWIIGIATLLILGTLISGIITGVFFDPNALNLFNAFMNPSILTSNSANTLFGQLGQSLSFLALPVNILTILVNTLLWDYPFFTGVYTIVKLFFIAMSLGVVWGIVQSVLGGQRLF